MGKSPYSHEEAQQILKRWLKTSENAAGILKAMGHPVRFLILLIVNHSQCNVTSLEKAIGISQSLASQHLRVLRVAGLVEPVRGGKEICYRIVDERVKGILNLFDM